MNLDAHSWLLNAYICIEILITTWKIMIIVSLTDDYLNKSNLYVDPSICIIHKYVYIIKLFL